MGSSSQREGAPVSERLFAEGYRFDLFQAVRLLERLAEDRARRAGSPAPHAVGRDKPAGEAEVVRFRALASLSFPTGAIAELRQPAGSERDAASSVGGSLRDPRPVAERPDYIAPEMTVACMGLTGPSGVLPHHYTNLLIERIRARDFALRDFLDLFNHRAISLFYRAWEKYRFPLGYERAAKPQAADDADLHGHRPAQRRSDDLFTTALRCLVGLGTDGLRDRVEVDDEAFLYYAGHFAHFPRSAVALETMLADYFDLRVQVEQFQGQWMRLGEDERSYLPGPKHPEGLNCALGVNLVVGERVWGVESKFRVRLGPLDYKQFLEFIPTGRGLKSLCQLVHTYAGFEYDFDVQPVLKPQAVPWCRLGGDGADPARLGWNTWVRSGEFAKPVDDAVFVLDGRPSRGRRGGEG